MATRQDARQTSSSSARKTRRSPKMKFALTKERNPQSKIEKENRSRTRPGETLIETEPEELRWKAGKGEQGRRQSLIQCIEDYLPLFSPPSHPDIITTHLNLPNPQRNRAATNQQQLTRSPESHGKKFPFSPISNKPKKQRKLSLSSTTTSKWVSDTTTHLTPHSSTNSPSHVTSTQSTKSSTSSATVTSDAENPSSWG
uniref:Uncharacterized protein n=1 Tax=Brassica oleracea TaxID=3712 RepID=A0A3P6GC56_BRAOL|nr:unnamed protein product [Brassica oleracea]